MLSVGVAGLGRMGKLHLLNALHNKNANVVAIADVSKLNQKAAKKYNVKIYGDYKKMIESEDLDAIIVSLPNFLKKESVAFAAEKDLAIFVDKPLARNFGEAEEIVKTVKMKNVPLMTGVNYRYFDSVQKVRNIVDQGMFGEIVIATSELIMDGPFSHPLVPRPVSEWWFDKEKAGGGVLLDLGYHLTDLFNWMFGDLTIEFSVLGHRYNMPIEDSATVVLKSLKTGTRCVLNIGWFSKMIFPNFNFRFNLHGTVGYVSTDWFAPRNLYLHAAKEGVKNLLRRVTGKTLNYLSYTYYYASFAKILDQFFESVKNGSEMPVSLQEQLSVMKTLDEVYRQSEGIKIG